ncbi:MAG TPA: ABC transporter permease [Chloroflexota bacterium]|nr:ABC transporter permease [Chloroflexota bacterium]
MRSGETPIAAGLHPAPGDPPPVNARPPARAGVGATVLEWFRTGAWLTLTPWIILALLVVLYGSRQSGVYTFNELNILTGETLTLILIAFGQTLVIVTGGIDLSIGGMLSLVTSLAALHLGTGGAQMWIVMAVLIVGATAAGAVNGLLIGVTRMQPFIVTLATSSIFGGAALWILPTTGGTVPSQWVSFGNGTWLGVSTAVWLLLLLGAFWLFFKRTRLWFEIRSVGSSQEAAFLSGVPVVRTIITTYAISGLFAALAALYYITQAVSGSPTVGTDYILTSVIAVVLGGTALTGGRGGFGGTIAGAFIPTLIGSVIFIYNIDNHWQSLLEGVLLIIAVLLNVWAAYLVRRRNAQ